MAIELNKQKRVWIEWMNRSVYVQQTDSSEWLHTKDWSLPLLRCPFIASLGVHWLLVSLRQSSCIFFVSRFVLTPERRLPLWSVISGWIFGRILNFVILLIQGCLLPVLLCWRKLSTMMLIDRVWTWWYRSLIFTFPLFPRTNMSCVTQILFRWLVCLVLDPDHALVTQSAIIHGNPNSWASQS